MSRQDNVFDFILPFSSKQTKWLVVYFGNALECDSPILEALYFIAWAEVRTVDSFGLAKALYIHYSSLFKCVPVNEISNVNFSTTNNQLVCLPLANGDHFSFGIGFIGKLINDIGFNLSIIVEQSCIVVVFLPDIRVRRPLKWHEHLLDNYIAKSIQ